MFDHISGIGRNTLSRQEQTIRRQIGSFNCDASSWHTNTMACECYSQKLHVVRGRTILRGRRLILVASEQLLKAVRLKIQIARNRPANFGVKLMRPGFGPAAELPASAPPWRRHAACRAPVLACNSSAASGAPLRLRHAGPAVSESSVTP
jgi:hypothetical protein